MKEEKKLPEAGSLILYREVPEKHILQDILELSYLAEAGVQDEELLALCLQELTELVKELAPFREVFVTQAGCTVSSHCGPGTLGILFLRRD